MFRVKLSERCDVSSHTNAAATRHPSNPGASRLRESLRADLADVGGDALPPSLPRSGDSPALWSTPREELVMGLAELPLTGSEQQSVTTIQKKKKGWLDDCQGMEGGRLRLQNCCRQNSYAAFL